MIGIEDIKHVSVIGAGFMGIGIARLALLAGFEKVTINDVSIEALERATMRVEEYLRAFESEEQFKQYIAKDNDWLAFLGTADIGKIIHNTSSAGIMAEGINADTIINRLVVEPNLEKAVSDADFIIESVTENYDLKQEIFKNIGLFAPKDSILATNTSSLRISKIGAYSGRSDKLIGMHFHGEPGLGRLIEVGKTDKSLDQAMEIGVQIAERLPCVTGARFVAQIEKESPGYIGNRFLIVQTLYLSWIFDQYAEKKIPWEQLEADLGGAVCESNDSIGVDVSYYAMKGFESELSSDFAPGKVLTELVQKGNLGKKVGKGFYEYDESGHPKVNESLRKQKTGLIDSAIVGEEMMATQLNEGCRLLEEGVVNGYRILEKVLLIGNYTPSPFKLGKTNYERWSNMLDALAEKIGKPYLKPCDLMRSGEFTKMRNVNPNY